MSNTDTIYSDNGTTRFIFRHNKGACSGTTTLSVEAAREAIKGVDLPTAKERAEEKARRLLAGNKTMNQINRTELALWAQDTEYSTDELEAGWCATVKGIPND